LIRQSAASLNEEKQMYAIEFETSIDNGIVHIPEIYKALQKSKKAKVIVIIDEMPEEENKQELAFGNFLNNTRKVDNLTIFSRNDLHER
jgi:hypothetical protein